MEISRQGLDGIYTLTFTTFFDARGSFVRVADRELLKANGLESEYVQLNHSYTKAAGTLRGLHFQYPPYGEIKILKVLSGVIQDVVVDIRKDSPTFLHHLSNRLDKESGALYIDRGFAHGFLSLSDEVNMLYMHSSPYVPQSEGGILYNDPALDICWEGAVNLVSDKDRGYAKIDDRFGI